jgi:CspA family cold shock protein
VASRLFTEQVNLLDPDSLDELLAGSGMPRYLLDLRKVPAAGPVAEGFAAVRSSMTGGQATPLEPLVSFDAVVYVGEVSPWRHFPEWGARPRLRHTEPVTSSGVVRFYRAEEGWGVIDGPDVPGGCWVPFSAIAGDRQLIDGQRVSFRAEAAEQDGYEYRAVKVWTGATEPDDTRPDDTATDAYTSALTLSFDDEA